ncbi:MAG: hypothetical protein KBF78_17235 [Fuscovulum sp.]|nr:hypothetical protein [Fuscovulum sp.]
MAHVPQAWNDLIAAHRRVHVANDVRRNRHQPQTERDRATADYARAVDDMFAAMEQLSEVNDTGRITLLLSRKERA